MPQPQACSRILPASLVVHWPAERNEMRISQMRRGIEEFLHRHARHLGAGLLLLGGFCLFVPWFPLTTRSDYYEYCMHLAVSQGWQFGTDILATYGPLGFIGLPFYQDSTYTVLIAASVGLYWFSVVVLGGFWRSTIKQSRPPAAWIVGILLLPSLTPTIEWLPTLFVPFVLVNVLVLRHFFADGPQDLGRLMALTAVLAGFVLVKGSFSFLICMGVAIVALDQVIRWRRSPWIVLVFGASILALWIVSTYIGKPAPGSVGGAAPEIGSVPVCAIAFCWRLAKTVLMPVSISLMACCRNGVNAGSCRIMLSKWVFTTSAAP